MQLRKVKQSLITYAILLENPIYGCIPCNLGLSLSTHFVHKHFIHVFRLFSIICVGKLVKSVLIYNRTLSRIYCSGQVYRLATLYVESVVHSRINFQENTQIQSHIQNGIKCGVCSFSLVHCAVFIFYDKTVLHHSSYLSFFVRQRIQ